MSGIKGIQNSFGGFLDKIGNAADKLGNLKTSRPSFSANSGWINRLNEQIGGEPEVRTKEKFSVKLPADQDPQKLRDNLLRDNLGFTDEDIAEYDKLTENKGFYLINSKKPDKRATAKDVGNWKTANGFVEINVSNEKAAELRSFRVGRVLDKSLENIGDPLLRETVKTDLMKIYNAEGFDKTNAAERLINLEVENHDDARTIRDSIRTFAEQKETKNNPVVQILAAKIELADISRTQNKIASTFAKANEAKPTIINKLLDKKNDGGLLNSSIGRNPVDVLMPLTEADARALEQTKELRQKIAAYQAKLQTTAKTAGGFDGRTGKKSPTIKVNREEAAWVNRQAADVYRALGNEGEAQKREMMMRFYQVDDKERNSVKVKGYKIIPLYKKGEYAVTVPENSSVAPSQIKPTPKEFGEDPFKLETKKYEKKYKVVETMWRNGRPSTEVQQGTVKGYERNYQMDGSLRLEEKVEKTEEQYTVKNGKRRIEIKREYTKTEIIKSPELNPKGVSAGNRAAGVAGLADEWNRWMMFRINSVKATKEINEMTKAKQEHFLKNNYITPPKPGELSGVKFQLETKFGKENSKEMMKFVEEASYAVWGK